MAQNSKDLGYPVQIVTLNENGEFELNDKALKEILFHESICDTPTVVVSIAGDYRKGKSLFKFDSFLKYFFKIKTNSLIFFQANLLC